MARAYVAVHWTSRGDMKSPPARRFPAAPARPPPCSLPPASFGLGASSSLLAIRIRQRSASRLRALVLRTYCPRQSLGRP
jgi:hypothetical protein